MLHTENMRSRSLIPASQQGGGVYYHLSQKMGGVFYHLSQKWGGVFYHLSQKGGVNSSTFGKQKGVNSITFGGEFYHLSSPLRAASAASQLPKGFKALTF